MKSAAVILFSVLAWTASGSAMIMRHDRADSLYLEMGQQFPCVGQIMRMGGATLIAPDVAVTAAHVAAAIQHRYPNIQFDGEQYGISEILIFPQTSQRDFTPDLALLKLDRNVEDIEPARLYTLDNERGREIYFVGCGNSGTGNEGVTLRDGKRRGATNVIDSVSMSGIYFDLDSADTATELEGINGPGDSGSPTLLVEDGKTYLVGVSSHGVPGPNGLFRYGCGDVHVRVKSFASMIQQEVPSRFTSVEPPEPSAIPFTRVVPSERPLPQLPDDSRGKCVQEFVKAFSSRDSGKFEQYSQTYRTASALSKRTAEQRREWYEQSLTDFGVIELLQANEQTESIVETSMITEIGAVLTFLFTFSTTEHGQLESLEIE